jgi:DNA-binding NarL/FixJ family response regulator
VEMSPPSRVLLGSLDPIRVLGLRRVLAEDGIEVVGQEDEPARLVSQAQHLRPDSVVLDLSDERAHTVAQRIQQASPETKVVLWSRDETVMEVIDPGSDEFRLVVVARPEGLCSELTRRRSPVEE